jgi:hypothetical protein
MAFIVNMDEVKLLAPIVDRYFRCIDDPQYVILMDGIADELMVPEDTLLEFMSYLILAPPEVIQTMLDLFFEEPYERMLLYTVPKPVESLPRAPCLCPSPRDGPYPWQTILAQWRTQVLRY